MVIEERTARSRAGTTLAGAGVLAVLGALGAILALHVLPPSSQVDPVRRTISEYALLDDGWVFDTAVLALAAGSAAVLVSLIRQGIVRARSAGTVLGALWCASLVVLVIFQKHNWALGPSAHGTVHRVASLVAFVSLPLAAIVITRRWRRHPRWDTHASVAGWLGVATFVWFLPLLGAVVIRPFTGVPWYRAIPLGLVERLLALNAVLAVLALGAWALAAARTPAAEKTRLST